MRRSNRAYFKDLALGASTDVTTAAEIVVGRDGYVGIQVLVDNGAGAAPTDSPAGTWELWAYGGRRWTLVDAATVVTELARIAPSGNAVVDKWAVLVGVPGSACRLRYNRTGGGGGNSRANVDVSTW